MFGKCLVVDDQSNVDRRPEKNKNKKEKISLRLLNRIRPSERNVIHHVKKSGNNNKKKKGVIYILGGDYMASSSAGGTEDDSREEM